MKPDQTNKPITAESFQKNQNGIVNGFYLDTDKTAAEVSFELHKKGIQQMLDKAGEELPLGQGIDLGIAPIAHETFDYMMQYNEYCSGLVDSAMWMRQLCLPIIARYRDENEKLTKQAAFFKKAGINLVDEKAAMSVTINKLEETIRSYPTVLTEQQSEIAKLKGELEESAKHLIAQETAFSKLKEELSDWQKSNEGLTNDLYNCSAEVESLKADMVGFANWLSTRYECIIYADDSTWKSFSNEVGHEIALTSELLSKYNEEKK